MAVVQQCVDGRDALSPIGVRRSVAGLRIYLDLAFSRAIRSAPTTRLPGFELRFFALGLRTSSSESFSGSYRASSLALMSAQRKGSQVGPRRQLWHGHAPISASTRLASASIASAAPNNNGTSRARDVGLTATFAVCRELTKF